MNEYASDHSAELITVDHRTVEVGDIT